MQQRVAPVPVPVLEKDAVELVIHARIRRAEDDGHVIGRRVVDPEGVDVAGFDRGLAIFVRQFPDRAVNLHGADAVLDGEVFRLELMEVHGRAFGSAGAVDEVAEVRGDRSFDVASVGLAEAEGSPWKWWEEFGGE